MLDGGKGGIGIRRLALLEHLDRIAEDACCRLRLGQLPILPALEAGDEEHHDNGQRREIITILLPEFLELIAEADGAAGSSVRLALQCRVAHQLEKLGPPLVVKIPDRRLGVIGVSAIYR